MCVAVPNCFPMYIGQELGIIFEGLKMARTVRNKNLQTREARARLKAQGKPHWQVFDQGRHLGYPRGKRGGA